MEALDPVIRDALVVTALLCFPILAVATVVGTVIAVLQAATQVQEQTLTLLPKMLAVGGTIVLFGGFGLHLCATLFTSALALLPAIARGSS